MQETEGRALADIDDTRACDMIVDATPVFSEDEADIDQGVNRAEAWYGTDESIDEQSQKKSVDKIGGLPGLEVDDLRFHHVLANRLAILDEQCNLNDDPDDKADQTSECTYKEQRAGLTTLPRTNNVDGHQGITRY